LVLFLFINETYFSSFFVLILTLSLAACQRSATSEVATPIAGQERDAQGCIPTAGYVWSPVRNACVKVFEAGLAFDPTPYNPDQTLHAFVVTAPANSNKVKAAELYWPGEAAPWPLDVVHIGEGNIRPLVLASQPRKVKIYRTSEGAYLLERDGKVLYTFGPKDGNALNSITWRK
jgi:hypothetical protein